MSGGRILYLSGGVGGSKLALGLANVLPPERLRIVANTGDDFDHLGLRVCPDIDTLVYTLSGRVNEETGWGRADDSGAFMGAVRELGGPDWFFLGDRDLAMHVERTRRLREGDRLTTITAELAAALGVGPQILPMSDAPAPTVVLTRDGPIAFQDYFVRLRAAPAVTGFTLIGGGRAQATPEFRATLADPGLAGIIIGPSNPFISIDPILALPGVREALKASPAPVLAVSPIVGGDAIKGPTAKMMRELGQEPSSTAVARLYGDIVDRLVIDPADRAEAAAIAALGPEVTVVPTLMRTLADKTALARAILELL